ncbi:Uncharacterized protein dnl_56070 [Desulfonema limicola]|uniref:DUF4124 domain-containing protein n=1 Tax=Desulfonema limicola TaxID=45656 RepID=A0A975BD77_9BACT|nr:hypothetical protein [Desulfonema limicola]QTA83211.1 Uncharacterized protein dnl_56070 [Desulfonema limicola]
MKQLLISIFIFIFSSLVFTYFSYAEKLYKYKAKDGTWHFTNIPPVTDQPVKVSTVQIDERKKDLQSSAGGQRRGQNFMFIMNFTGLLNLSFY